jgi:hypothetical protein
MRGKQQGITVIGLIALLALLGVVGFAGLKLVPIYLEQMKIAGILNDVKFELDGQKPSIQVIKSEINKRLNIEMIRDMDARAKNFKISKSENGYMLQAKYERRTPYLANIYLVVTFDRSVEIIR